MSLLAAILAAWLIAGGSVLGVGLLLSRFDGLKPKQASDWFDAFWLGFAATVALLQVWHIVFAVNAWLVICLGVLGAIGMLTHIAWSDLTRAPSRPALLAAGAFALGAVWLALMGLRPLEIYDAGLYHLQAVAWDSAYPSVPGLGNLHGRLAFNSSFFLVLAMFGQGPMAGEAYRAAAGLLVFVFFGQVVVSIARVLRSEHASGADWLLALMALPTVAWVGTNGLATTSTDLLIFPLQVLIAYQLLRWLSRLDTSESGRYLGYAAVLAVAAVTIKLSSAGFAAGCVGLALFVAVSYGRGRELIVRSPPLVTLSLAVVLFAGLVANSLILSGYPLYPSTVLPFPVEWRVPATQANLDAVSVALAGRQPLALGAHTYEGWAWFPDWLAANAVDLAPPTIAAVLGLLLTVSVWTREADAIRRGFLLLAPVWGGLAIWFLTAPAYRFAGALLWLAGAIPVAALQACGRSRLTNLTVVVFVLVSMLPPQTEELSLMPRAAVASLRQGITSVPVVSMSTFVTDSGLELYVPVGTNQAWAGPLPSTPYPDPHLRLRCPDNMACGFVRDPAP